MSLWLTTAGAVPHAHAAIASASGGSPLDTAPAATAAQCASGDAAALPAFRLGTAGRPLGWSTAVGDFNTDGTPDLAIADRISHSAGGYAYQIQFSVSGRASRTVAFESEHDALTVKVSDVDHDNDLDVVVSSSLSHEIVGIWLNDGRGGFEATDVRQFPSESPLLRSVDAADPSVDATTSGLLPRRAADGLPVEVRAALTAAPRSLCTAQPNRLQPALHTGAVASRAPPPPAAS